MIHPRRIALLGGGQLGRMFIENALRYDVEIHVLDPDPNCSCAHLAHRFVQGRFDDRDTVIAFAANADVVGIEIEHVSVDALEELERMGKHVVPSSATLRIIQDKGLQKNFYQEHGLPSAAFALLDGASSIRWHADLLPAFLKTRTGGYDGKGVIPIRSTAERVEGFDVPCVLEEQVNIAKELAVLVVRSTAGEQVSYDPVEMVFNPELNLVDHLRAPAQLDNALMAAARALATRVAEAFAAPGLYAVELFLTENGELLVNETAPRAHNSGHHTIEACTSSQFDQLLRVYMGWPLGDPSLRSPSAMVNVIGSGGTGEARILGMGAVLALPGTSLHLYGKKETRTGRKMGHVTVVATDPRGLDHAIATIKEQLVVLPA